MVAGPDNITPPATSVYVDGVVVVGNNPTTTQVGSSNLYSVTFTPTLTGVHSFIAFGLLALTVPCRTFSVAGFVMDIHDEALGSWSWDKAGGTLTFYRQNGSVLNTFMAVDNLTTASRELQS